jgi:D-3-phosphoglycerate dehydrogenase
MNKILILDGVDKKAVEVLEKEFQVDVKPSMTNEQLKEIIGNYDALIVRSQTKVNKESIDASNLKIIGRAGVGVDNIDVEAATRKGIIVVNSPDGNTVAAAEHTIALLMSSARYIPDANKSLKNGEWKRKEFTGVELYNKTLGIIGLGRIGSHVAKVCNSMGMNVIAYDPYMNNKKAEENQITPVELEKIFTNSDFITIHVPLTPETKNLINLESMKKMKKSARIVNCSRGGIVNETDIIEAVNSGIISGAALDVFETEPLKDSPLQQTNEKIIITPHLGASTEEAQINVAIDVANQIKGYLNGEGKLSAVNLTGMDVSQDIKPYLNIAVKIGKITGQLSNGSIKAIEVTYKGELSNKSNKALTTAVIKGILSPILGDTINYVNAQTVAKDRGISIEEINSSQEINYKSVITVKAKFDNGEEKLVSGTIVSETEERIISLDEYDINFIPKGILLATQNIDKPGMVGKVGTVLGKNNVNIARMDLGRNHKAQKAIMIINIDENISEDIKTELKTMEGILDIRVINID